MVLLAFTPTPISAFPTISHEGAEGLDAKISGKPMLRSLGSVQEPSRSLGFLSWLTGCLSASNEKFKDTEVLPKRPFDSSALKPFQPGKKL